jgi:hypothetical protein
MKEEKGRMKEEEGRLCYFNTFEAQIATRRIFIVIIIAHVSDLPVPVHLYVVMPALACDRAVHANSANLL